MFDHLLIPAPEAPATGYPQELSAAGALAELRDALAGWIDDDLENLDGYVHDSDRADVRQIMASLFNAADQFKYATAVERRVGTDRVRRYQRAGRQITFAAEQLQSGFLIAARLAQVPTVDTTAVYVDDQAPAVVATFYAAAVAYVRQAYGMLHGTPGGASSGTRPAAASEQAGSPA